MAYFYIEFVGEQYGIGVCADSKETAIKIAEKRFDWKEGKPRKVSYIKEY